MLKGCKFKLLPTTVAVSSALFTQIAVADSESEHEKMVVMGNPLQATEVFIDSEQLERQQANDINDIFRTDPEVSIGGGTGVAQKIYVRGLEDSQLNVTIDGAVQSGNIFHHQGRLSIEPELLKQVEVAAGAGRATDGAGALGGAIRFKTKDAEDMLQGGERFGGLVKAGYYDNTEGYKTSVSGYGYLTDNVSVVATMVYSDLGNYTDGDGNEQPFTEAQNKVGFIKLVGDITDAQKITLSYDHRGDEAYRNFRPHWAESRKNFPLDQEMNRDTFTLNYGLNPADNPYLELDVTAYNTETELKHKSRPDAPRETNNIAKTHSYGGDIRNTSSFNSFAITYGVDYRKDTTDGTFLAYSPDTYEFKGTVAGVYLQSDFRIVEPLLLSVGGRYDTYELEDSYGTEVDHSGFSPNVSLNYSVIPGLNVYAGYAEAFRGAQIPDSFMTDIELDPNRKAERAHNTEVGASWVNGGLNLSATAYINKIDDVVGKSAKNQGDLETKGFTARAGYTFNDLSMSLSFNHSRSDLDGQRLIDENFGIGTSTGDTWVADINYYVLDNLLIGYTGRYVDRLDDAVEVVEIYKGEEYVTNYSEKPGYAVHDIYSQWQPLSGEELTLSLAVKNLFDKDYRDHASYGDVNAIATAPREPGRDIRFNVAYAF